MQALAEKESTRGIGQSDFLTEWIKNGALVSLILDAVPTVDWTESEFELAAGSGYAFRPLVMLTLVTYGCATGVCSSKDIALKTSQDAILRFLCEGTFPTWQDIREFRRHNRDLIKRTIIEARKLIHEFGLRSALVHKGNCQWDGLEGIQDRTRDDQELQFARAAEEWIERAEELDAQALDD